MIKKITLICCWVCTVMATDGTIRKIELINGAANDNVRSIETIDKFKTSVKICIPSVILENVDCNSVGYQNISIKNMSYTSELGNPQIPVVRFSLVIPPGTEPQIQINSKSDTIIDNVIISPKLDRGLISPDYRKIPEASRNESIYSKSEYYPSKIAVVKDIGVYRGNEIAYFELYPVLCNPVLKKILVTKNLELTVSMVPVKSLAKKTNDSYSGEEPMQINYGQKNVLFKTSSGSQNFFNDSDTSTDIVIITIPGLKAPADTLALWHAMKGYETIIVTSNSWSTKSVLDSVTRYYKKSTPAPSYLLILGDIDQVPMNTYILPGETGDDMTARIDYDYALMDGVSDKIPDLARGRIPANNITEAYAAIRKIIKYERTPSASSSFYSNILAATFFQPKDGSTTDEDQGFSFAKTIEDIRSWFIGKSYSVTRAYKAESSVTPKKWWTSNYNDAKLIDLPSELQKPQFAWNASSADVNKTFNDGIFLAYHYDHGFEPGWADPNWTVDNIQLNNGDKLPVIYSINCLTGSLHYKSKCFAEKLILSESGGAAGIIAASAVTFSSENIAFLRGLIEQTWPGYVKDGQALSPVYTLGDIMDKTFIRMKDITEEFTKKEYLLFGDPTTSMYTKKPATINVTHVKVINKKATSFEMSGMSISKGIATLVDKKSSRILGKVQIKGATATIPIKGSIPDNADLVLTVASENSTPYQASINTTTSVAFDKITQNQRKVMIYLKGISPIAIDPSEKVILSMYDLQGKVVYKSTINNVFGNIPINHSVKVNGTYFIDIQSIRTGYRCLSKLVIKK